MKDELFRLAGLAFLSHEQAKPMTLGDIVVAVYGLIGALSALFLLLLAATWPTGAHAVEIPLHVFEDEAVSLQLFAAPCENEAAKLAVADSPLAPLADKLQKAKSTWGVVSPVGIIRVDFAGCWVEFNFRGKHGYAVAFEDGEIRFFPAESFKRTKGQSGA